MAAIYQAQMSVDGGWHTAGPGDGFNCYGRPQNADAMFIDKSVAEQVARLLDQAYLEGSRARAVAIRRSLGFPE